MPYESKHMNTLHNERYDHQSSSSSFDFTLIKKHDQNQFRNSNPKLPIYESARLRRPKESVYQRYNLQPSHFLIFTTRCTK